MPKYKIHRNFGYVGAHDWEIVDAENEDDANKQAWDFALEKVESWVEECSEDEE